MAAEHRTWFGSEECEPRTFTLFPPFPAAERVASSPASPIDPGTRDASPETFPPVAKKENPRGSGAGWGGGQRSDAGLSLPVWMFRMESAMASRTTR